MWPKAFPWLPTTRRIKSKLYYGLEILFWVLPLLPLPPHLPGLLVF